MNRKQTRLARMRAADEIGRLRLEVKNLNRRIATIEGRVADLDEHADMNELLWSDCELAIETEGP